MLKRNTVLLFVMALLLFMAAPYASAYACANNEVVIVAKAELEPSNGQVANGTAILIFNPVKEETKVMLFVKDLEPGSSHAAHIHSGACTGPILYPLNNVVANKAGFGKSVTIIEAPIDTENWWVNVHRDPTLPSPGITCGKVEALVTKPQR